MVGLDGKPERERGWEFMVCQEFTLTAHIKHFQDHDFTRRHAHFLWESILLMHFTTGCSVKWICKLTVGEATLKYLILQQLTFFTAVKYFSEFYPGKATGVLPTEMLTTVQFAAKLPIFSRAFTFGKIILPFPSSVFLLQRKHPSNRWQHQSLRRWR